MEIIFRAVPTLETAGLWPKAQHLFPENMRLWTYFRPGDIQSRLADERMQLWTAEVGGDVEAVCLTQVLAFPKCRVLDIVAIGGNGYGLWGAWFKDLMKCAEIMDCKFVASGQGRDGWARVMKDSGLEEVGRMYSAEVGHA